VASEGGEHPLNHRIAATGGLLLAELVSLTNLSHGGNYIMTTPTSKAWQELGDEFHMMVGYCIAQWASVDNELFRIFRECIGPYEQSVIVYYRTPGLDVRLSLVDEIVKSVLPKPSRKSGGHDHSSVISWKSAIAGFRDLLSIRRRIAHHPIAIRHEPFRAGVSRAGEAPPSWFEIYVSQHEQLRANDLPALKVKDLRSHQAAVVSLRDRLHRFFYDVLTKPKPTSSASSLRPKTRKSPRMDRATKPRPQRRPSHP
jgi:hypothetical protein